MLKCVEVVLWHSMQNGYLFDKQWLKRLENHELRFSYSNEIIEIFLHEMILVLNMVEYCELGCVNMCEHDWFERHE